ncbi:MAG: protease FtsH-inhibitory lysogeny factor CIII [Mixta calida]|nr:protease FtsH-inhibitory lysogeny factor CIII [Pantoea sp.]MDU5192207.1 protease FtsH-inhibitory lysogeny factor CIII [Mixta calida]
MTLSICGGFVVDIDSPTESLLELITRRLRSGWKSLISTLSQQGRP